VIFDPDVYPVNLAVVHGKVSKEWQEHEHPLENVPLEENDDLVTGNGSPEHAVAGKGRNGETAANNPKTCRLGDFTIEQRIIVAGDVRKRCSKNMIWPPPHGPSRTGQGGYMAQPKNVYGQPISAKPPITLRVSLIP